jgi:hypothetical protein
MMWKWKRVPRDPQLRFAFGATRWHSRAPTPELLSWYWGELRWEDSNFRDMSIRVVEGRR